MDLSKITISCTKSDCPGHASLHQSGCEFCETPVTKRYLRVLQKPRTQITPNQLLGERYFVIEGHSNIVLDTMPDKRPEVIDDFSEEIECYLKLSTNLLHCPKVFGLTEPQGKWLLEYPSVSLKPSGLPLHQDLFEPLTEAWPKAEPLQQLNWLSQIAGMIYSFSQQGVAG